MREHLHSEPVVPEISYEENARRALDGLIVCGWSPKGYDDVSVEDIHPTPLDSERVQLAASEHDQPGHNRPLGYYEAAMIELGARAHEACERAGLPEGWELNVIDEIVAQNTIRVSHNSDAYARLRQALEQRPASVDLLQSIQRARGGMASTAEMVSLLAAYPEMVSIETHKITKPFDSELFDEVDARIRYELAALQHMALPGGEIIIALSNMEGEPFGSWTFLDTNGTLVEKQVVAEINVPGNRFELIRKMTTMIMPGELQLTGVAPRFRLVDLPDGNELFINAQPLSLTYYMRTYDYRQRLAYAEQAPVPHPLVGARAIKAALKDYDLGLVGDANAAVLAQIPDQSARDMVYESIVAALRRSGP